VDELVLDVLPDNASHLVAIEFHDGILDFNLLERGGRHGAPVNQQRRETCWVVLGERGGGCDSKGGDVAQGAREGCP